MRKPGNTETRCRCVESQADPVPPFSSSAHTWLFMNRAVEKGHYGPCATIDWVWTTHSSEQRQLLCWEWLQLRTPAWVHLLTDNSNPITKNGIQRSQSDVHGFCYIIPFDLCGSKEAENLFRRHKIVYSVCKWSKINIKKHNVLKHTKTNPRSTIPFSYCC